MLDHFMIFNSVLQVWKKLSHEAIGLADIEAVDITLLNGLLYPLLKIKSEEEFEEEYPDGCDESSRISSCFFFCSEV